MPHKATPLKRAAFLAAYRETGTVRAAAEAAGIDRTSHYRWLEDPEYAEQFAQAIEEAGESLEAEARRRAVAGWEEPVYHQGKLVGHKRRYSDTLLIFLMKGAMPEKYGDKFQQTLTGPSTTQVEVEFVDDFYGKPKGAALEYYGDAESA